MFFNLFFKFINFFENVYEKVDLHFYGEHDLCVYNVLFSIQKSNDFYPYRNQCDVRGGDVAHSILYTVAKDIKSHIYCVIQWRVKCSTLTTVSPLALTSKNA